MYNKMSNFSPMYFEQPIVVFDTTETLSATTGAFVLYGGLSVNSTYQSTGLTSGSFVLGGGAAVGKDLWVGGVAHIKNTTQSFASNSGALVIDGGLGVAKDINVGGSVTIVGDLYVQGTRTEVNTTTINVSDNTLLLNSGPSGSRDAGVFIQRYQTDVDDGSGDVVNSPAVYTDVTNTSTGSTSVYFSPTASGVTDFYKGWWLLMTTGTAQDEVRKITTYNGTTKVATLSSAFTVDPTDGDQFTLHNENFVGNYYDETDDEFKFIYINDITDIQTDLLSAGYAPIHAATVTAVNGDFTNITATNFVVTNITAGTIAISSANLASATITNLVSSFATIGSLDVTGVSTLMGGATTGSIFVSNGSVFSNLGFSGGSLNISGNSILLGTSTVGTLFVSNATVLVGGATSGSILVSNGSIDANLGVSAGSLNVSGNSTLTGTMTVSGGTVLVAGLTSGNIFVSAGSIVSDLGMTGGSLYVSGQSVLLGGATTGTIFVSNGSVVSDLGFSGGALLISGASIQQGGITSGSIFVSNGSIVSDFGLTGGSILITGQATLQSGLTSGSIFVSNGSVVSDFGFTGGELLITGASVQQGGITAGSIFVSNGSIVSDFGFSGGALLISGESTLQGSNTLGSLFVSSNTLLDGTLTVTGGTIMTSVTSNSLMVNTVDMTPSLGDIFKEQSATLANGQAIAAPISGFSFGNSIVRAFDAILSVTIDATSGGRYAYYNLKGVQRASNWVLNSSFVGDNIGITFSIDNAGQIKYTSTSVGSFVSDTCKFRALTTSV